MKKLLFIAICVFFTVVASAQVAESTSRTINVESSKKVNPNNKGFDRINASFTSIESIANRPFNLTGVDFYGLDAGWDHGWNITGNKLPLFIETGAHFWMTFYTYTPVETFWYHQSEETRPLYGITIPITATYQFAFGPGFYIAPAAGFYLKANMNDLTYNHPNDPTTGLDLENSTIQAGIQAGLNVGYKMLNLSFTIRKDFVKNQTTMVMGGIGLNIFRK